MTLALETDERDWVVGAAILAHRAGSAHADRAAAWDAAFDCLYELGYGCVDFDRT